MEMQILWLLLIAGSMAQEDMDRNVFLFPSQSVADYVVLTPMVTEPLDKLTVCWRSYSISRRYAFFNVGTPKSQIEMSVVLQSVPCYSSELPYCFSNIVINNEQVSIPEKADPLEWNHICVTWDSNTGVLQLWVNGKVSPRTVLQEGSSIDLQDGIILGQKRLYYRNEWDSQISFQGEICDVHMWNRVLSPENLKRVLLHKRYRSGNVISWRSLNYTVNGNVTVQPKLQSIHGCESDSLHKSGMSQQNIEKVNLEAQTKSNLHGPMAKVLGHDSFGAPLSHNYPCMPGRSKQKINN
ncbi:C-reactive protein-like [Xenopus laevis]|uniref:C-reactive protein-like n=1 Tax=Xenopus laevis TaxID=8355 RepID=A0A8J0TRG1_XENLA|nr:C-reactive protein-like [Xenopus laevis]